MKTGSTCLLLLASLAVMMMAGAAATTQTATAIEGKAKVTKAGKAQSERALLMTKLSSSSGNAAITAARTASKKDMRALLTTATTSSVGAGGTGQQALAKKLRNVVDIAGQRRLAAVRSYAATSSTSSKGASNPAATRVLLTLDRVNAQASVKSKQAAGTFQLASRPERFTPSQPTQVPRRTLLSVSNSNHLTTLKSFSETDRITSPDKVNQASVASHGSVHQVTEEMALKTGGKGN